MTGGEIILGLITLSAIFMAIGKYQYERDIARKKCDLD